MNKTDRFNDPMVDLTNPEQIALASILQGSKMSQSVLRYNSKLRGKKRSKRRYKKSGNFSINTHAMDPYKDSFNEENKVDYSSVKAINKRLKNNIHAKRNLPKMESTSGHISEDTRRKKPPIVATHNSHQNEVELKLK